MGSSCSATKGQGQKEYVLRPAEPAVVNAVNRTGLELLHVLLADKGTVLNSPVSLVTPLTIAALGSQGETQAGILRAIGAGAFLDSPNGWAEKVRDVVGGLVSSDPKVTVLNKSAIFSERLAPSFVKSNAAADIELQKKPPKVADVNAWCKSATKDKIPEILDNSTPIADDSTVILNALYFKGEWKDRFDESLTRDGEFQGESGKMPCKMMMAKGVDGKFLYCETDTYQAAALPYGKGGHFSAVIVLPRGDSKPTISSFGGEAIPGKAAAPREAALDEVLKSLPDDWASLANPAESGSKLAQMKGALHFPRFKVDFKASLKEQLQSRGMTAAFTPEANFSVMLDSKAQVTDVLQRVTLEVDEVGSVAAAATAVVVSRGIVMEPSFSMTCDRPFIFAIRSSVSNAILFAAAVRAV
uniref:Serpin domain-containing protein n=1 Tax=Alexandrium catenella TaxID=2925 RepID=A0A7S1RY55_ALECA